MTLFEATHLMKREYNGNRMSRQNLNDVVVVFQGVLEDVHAMKRSHRRNRDMAVTSYPVYPCEADPVAG